MLGYNNFCDTLPARLKWGSFRWTEFNSPPRSLPGTELTISSPGVARQVTIINPYLASTQLYGQMLAGLIDACQYNWEQGKWLLKWV